MLENAPTTFLGSRSMEASPAETAGATERRELTPSEMHLLIVLGQEFRDPRMEEVREAHTHKLRRYLELYPFRYNESELESGILKQVDHDLVLSRGVDLLMEEISPFPQLHTLSHGTQGENLFLYGVWGQLRSILMRAPMASLLLRGHDLYCAGQAETLAELKSALPKGDYDGLNNARMACVNPGLAVGTKETASTSSSYEYWVSSHSVALARQAEVFKETAVLLGLPTAEFGPYLSLYLQDVATESPLGINGGMLQILVNPAHVDDLLEWGFHTSNNAPKQHSALLKRLRDVSAQAQAKQPPEESAKFVSEGRLYLHPKYQQDGTMRVRGHFFHPLSATQEERLIRKMRRSLALDLVDGLVANQSAAPGSIFGIEGDAWPIYGVLRDVWTGKAPQFGRISRDGLDAQKYMLLLALEQFGAEEIHKFPLPAGLKLVEAFGIVLERRGAAIAQALYDVLQDRSAFQGQRFIATLMQAALGGTFVQEAVQWVQQASGIAIPDLPPAMQEELKLTTALNGGKTLPVVEMFSDPSFSQMIVETQNDSLDFDSLEVMLDRQHLSLSPELMLSVTNALDGNLQRFEQFARKYMTEILGMTRLPGLGVSFVSLLLSTPLSWSSDSICSKIFLLRVLWENNPLCRVPETGHYLLTEMVFAADEGAMGGGGLQKRLKYQSTDEAPSYFVANMIAQNIPLFDLNIGPVTELMHDYIRKVLELCGGNLALATYYYQDILVQLDAFFRKAAKMPVDEQPAWEEEPLMHCVRHQPADHLNTVKELFRPLLRTPEELAADGALERKVQELVRQHTVLAIKAMPWVLKHKGLWDVWGEAMRRLQMPCEVNKYQLYKVCSQEGNIQEGSDLWEMGKKNLALYPFILDLLIQHYPQTWSLFQTRCDEMGTQEQVQEATCTYLEQNPEATERLETVSQYLSNAQTLGEIMLERGKGNLLSKMPIAFFMAKTGPFKGGVLSFLCGLLGNQTQGEVILLLQKRPELLQVPVLGVIPYNIFKFIPFINQMRWQKGSYFLAFLSVLQKIQQALRKAGLWQEGAAQTAE